MSFTGFGFVLPCAAMKNLLTRSKAKQVILLLGVFSFVFHAFIPYFHSAMAGAPDGYNQTICTVSGLQTVFVAFEDGQRQNPPDCYECPDCIVQANAEDWIETGNPAVEARVIVHQSVRNDPPFQVVADSVFPRFLSRAPPL